MKIGIVYGITHQAVGVGDEGGIRVDRRESMAGRQVGDPCALSPEDALGRREETISALLGSGVKRRGKVLRGPDVVD